MIGIEGVGQAIDDHRVDQADIAHLLPGAQELGVRGERHILLPASDHDARIAQGDRLRSQRDGAQARSADLIDGEGGAVHRHTCADGGLTSGVLSKASGQHMAQNDFIHLFGRNACLLQCGDDRGLAQDMRRRSAEGAQEAADRSALGGGNDDVRQSLDPLSMVDRFFAAAIASAAMGGKPKGQGIP